LYVFSRVYAALYAGITTTIFFPLIMTYIKCTKIGLIT
jgi:hypothetical protein